MKDETIEEFCERKGITIDQFEPRLDKTVGDLEQELMDKLEGIK